MSKVYNIEDIVIEASNKKRPRSRGAKGSSRKDGPREKHLGPAKEVSPIKTILSHLLKESETGGAVSDKTSVTVILLLARNLSFQVSDQSIWSPISMSLVS